MTQKKIIWEKWKDPCTSALEDYQRTKRGDDKYEYDPDDLTDEELEDRPYPIRGPVLAGPMGVIPIHESNVPAKIFNFWVGHANFDITQHVRDTIAKVPGVESLDIWTRYRFRVGIGKSFDKDVLLHIEKLFVQKVIDSKYVLNYLVQYLKKQKELPKWFVHKDNHGLLTIDSSLDDTKTLLMSSEKLKYDEKNK